jgi:esterase/lipase
LYKRKTITTTEKESTKNQIDEFNKQLLELKKIIKKRTREIETIYKQVSISLAAKCGLTSDVSDSIGIAYCNI